MFFFLEKTSFSKLWNSLNYIVFTNILTSVPFPHPSDREWPWVLWVLAGEMLLINALHSLIAIAFRHRHHQIWHEKPFSLIFILNTFSNIIICEGVSSWLPYHLNLKAQRTEIKRNTPQQQFIATKLGVFVVWNCLIKARNVWKQLRRVDGLLSMALSFVRRVAKRFRRSDLHKAILEKETG